MKATRSLLVNQWLGDGPAISIVDDQSAELVREEVRRVGHGSGVAAARVEALAVAASELVHNQLAHAGGGQVRVRNVERGGVAGVEVIAADSGPGIANPTAALRGERPSPRGLDAGLPAAYRKADEMDFDVRLGEGTCAVARTFATPLSRNEVAVLGRPCRGEPVSGDHAVVVRQAAELVIGLIDGLGHGRAAREPSERAASILSRRSQDPPLVVLDECDRALAGTRGAALSIARLDPAAGILVHAGAGNIAAHLYEGYTVERFSGAARVLGGHSSGAHMVEERHPLGNRYVLVMFTDGLSSRLDLENEPALRRQPPLIIAHHLLERFGHHHDDATVAVARLA